MKPPNWSMSGCRLVLGDGRGRASRRSRGRTPRRRDRPSTGGGTWVRSGRDTLRPPGSTTGAGWRRSCARRGSRPARVRQGASRSKRRPAMPLGCLPRSTAATATAAKTSPARDGDSDWTSGSSANRMPPNSAPVIVVTPPTKAKRKSTTLFTDSKSMVPTDALTPPNRPPARPAMADDVQNTMSFVRRMSRPSVAHAAGESRMARESPPERRPPDGQHADAHGREDRGAEHDEDAVAAEVETEQVEAADDLVADAEDVVVLEDQLAAGDGDREGGQGEIEPRQAQGGHGHERAERAPRPRRPRPTRGCCRRHRRCPWPMRRRRGTRTAPARSGPRIRSGRPATGAGRRRRGLGPRR